MKVAVKLLFVSLLVISTGCSATIPIGAYIPQNHVRLSGEIAVGDFSYQPFLDQKVQKANQFQNTAAGEIYAGLEIAELVKRGTALELEKTNVLLNENSYYQLNGNVLEFKLDDLGYSIDWTYKIKYSIVEQKTGAVVFENTYEPPAKTSGKFNAAADYEQHVNMMIGQGYEMFIKDLEVRQFLNYKE